MTNSNDTARAEAKLIIMINMMPEGVEGLYGNRASTAMIAEQFNLPVARVEKLFRNAIVGN